MMWSERPLRILIKSGLAALSIAVIIASNSAHASITPEQRADRPLPKLSLPFFLAASHVDGVLPVLSASVPPGSVPARVSDVSGLPPTFIGVGSIDLFCEEDIEYARRLIHAGVNTELMVVPGAYHGFDIVARDAKLTVEFRNAWQAALRRGLKLA